MQRWTRLNRAIAIGAWLFAVLCLVVGVVTIKQGERGDLWIPFASLLGVFSVYATSTGRVIGELDRRLADLERHPQPSPQRPA